MAWITLGQINDAIADAFRDVTVTMPGGAVHDLTVQSYNELTEGINDLPTLQVFWQGTTVDAVTETDRTTFGAGVVQGEYLFLLRAFARQRSHLADDMAAVLAVADAIELVLNDAGEDCIPFFGQDGLKVMYWSGERVVFEYGTVLYAGAEYSLRVRVS